LVPFAIPRFSHLSGTLHWITSFNPKHPIL